MRCWFRIVQANSQVFCMSEERKSLKFEYSRKTNYDNPFLDQEAVFGPLSRAFSPECFTKAC